MRIPSSRAHNRWHPDLEPVAVVAPGTELTLETRDGIDDQLGPGSTHADVLGVDLGLGHPLTGPFFVEGAGPGDVLGVELRAYETADFGVTPLVPGFGFLADEFTEPYLVSWEIRDGMARSAEGLRTALGRIPALREEYWADVGVPGTGEALNQSLERAGRVADFFELAELMCRDALHREESCGGHFRVEHQTDEGEAQRDDENFSFVGAWEYKGKGSTPDLHKEPLEFEFVKPSVRSYK